ncbi:hypothetical protein CPLU01_11637 [Colletotrichum plurivorum]|uniref:Uncharacterized protein n=1 Tax=Colletotrichum plurivorum TaxID=2175906 RepID=A0A8H6K0X1_9PEZI|nr:hypothetical protein CPLU01_11637 [Colletotrichum plurivorum]
MFTSTLTIVQLDGVVVIDFESYLKYQTANTPLLGDLHRYMGITECGCNECRQSFQEVYKSAWNKKTKDKKLSSEQLLMLPPSSL